MYVCISIRLSLGDLVLINHDSKIIRTSLNKTQVTVKQKQI